MSKNIKILDTDSLVTIVDKIRDDPSYTSAEIYLEIRSNEHLRNFLNLKTLLAIFADKKFFFITTDTSVKRIGEPLGIRYFYKNDDREFEEAYERQNILKHNFTFWEYLIYEVRKIFFRFLFLFRKKQTAIYRNRRMIPDSNVVLLFFGLFVSVGLLLFIFYFAVSRTYVYISPELTIKTVSRNLIFRESTGDPSTASTTNPNIISVKPFKVAVDLDHVFSVSVFDSGSVHSAAGMVEIHNELSGEQTLRPNTRFVTDQGLVYRSPDWIKVPSAHGDGTPGIVTAYVVADILDANNDIIGVRGNIPHDTILTIPALKFNRDKLFALTKSDLVGGQDPSVKILTQEELDTFKATLTENLKVKALDQLKRNLAEWNIRGSTQYAILPVDDIMSYTTSAVSIVGSTKVGDKTNEVHLAGKIELATSIYDNKSTLFYLRSLLNDMLLFGTEKLISVNTDSLRITNILSMQKNPFEMKGTTEIDSTISYNFEDASNNLTRKLKNLVVGTSAEEAKSILLNNTSIANVKIQFSPFWITRVANNPDNIEFIIQSQ